MIQKGNGCGSSVAIPPSIIIGGGRIGLALRRFGSGGDVVIGRGQNFPSEPSDGPIYVCTRNSELKDVVGRVPPGRHHDLVRRQLYATDDSVHALLFFLREI